MLRQVLAARLTYTAGAQREDEPTDKPVRTIAERTTSQRLITTSGWRTVGAGVLMLAGASSAPAQERLHPTIPPGVDGIRVHIRLDVP